ncbi:hypothetical protein MB02_17130 [Croceicoccus estronivorus]|nr:hypothetical protein MB02_17130 [Croceicoccus estronivorus]
MNQLLLHAAEGDMRVSLLTPEQMERYRKCVADIDIPDHEKDELIGIVAQIMAHFVDAAFGETSEQFILSARENGAFPSSAECGKLGDIPEKQRVDLGYEGASNIREP